jgi:hypothetical protein
MQFIAGNKKYYKLDDFYIKFHENCVCGSEVAFGCMKAYLNWWCYEPPLPDGLPVIKVG